MCYNTKNYMTEGGDELVIGGKLTVKEGAEVSGLSGGGSGGGYTLPTASADALGGIKAETKGAGDTVPCKIDGDGKLYVPTYPTVPGNATTETAGIVKALAHIDDAGEDVSDISGMKTAFNGLLAAMKTAGLML